MISRNRAAVFAYHQHLGFVGMSTVPVIRTRSATCGCINLRKFVPMNFV